MSSKEKHSIGGKIRFREGNHAAFYRVLRSRVAAHLASQGRDRYADWRLWLKAALYAAIAIAAYAAILANAFSAAGLLIAAIVYSTRSCCWRSTWDTMRSTMLCRRDPGSTGSSSR